MTGLFMPLAVDAAKDGSETRPNGLYPSGSESKESMFRRLGKKQQQVLQCLHEHGYWSPTGCGWLWDTYSGTTRIMQSLVRRALAVKTVEECRAKHHTIHRTVYGPAEGSESEL